MAGLEINMEKTKAVFNSLAREQGFAIGSEALKALRECIYLVQVVAADPVRETELEQEEWAKDIWQVF